MRQFHEEKGSGVVCKVFLKPFDQWQSLLIVPNLQSINLFNSFDHPNSLILSKEKIKLQEFYLGRTLKGEFMLFSSSPFCVLHCCQIVPVYWSTILRPSRLGPATSAFAILTVTLVEVVLVWTLGSVCCYSVV